MLNKKFANKNEESEDKMSKWQELFLMAQDKKKTKDRTDKHIDDIELAKNPEEYTFQPNAHKKRTATRREMSPIAPVHERLQEKSKTAARDRSQPAPIRGKNGAFV